MRAAEYSEAMALLGEVASASSAAGEAYLEALGLCYLGRLALAWGEHEQAREPLDRALALIRRVRPGARILPLVARAQLARAERDPALARQLLEEALTVARESGEGAPRALLALADLTADEGERLTARQMYEEALALAPSDCAEDYSAQALEALARLARVEGASREAGSLQREARKLRHARRQAGGLDDSLQASVHSGLASGSVVHAARLLGAANALRNLADAATPAAPRSKGREPSPPAPLVSDPTFAVNGSGVERVDPGAVPTDTSTEEDSMEGWERLTDRERQVAALVADGLTNKAVAEQLVLAPATVKTHLEHIFEKLEISGRAALAKEVWKRGGSTGPSGALEDPDTSGNEGR